jgi:hypothetical protein
MLRHPFFGVVVESGAGVPPAVESAAEVTCSASAPRSGRRGFFAQAAAATAGAAALLLGRSAQAQQSTVQVLPGHGTIVGGGTGRGTSGGVIVRRQPEVTTLALGEEGSAPPPRRERIYTTQAVGEEGGWYPPPRYPTPSYPPPGTVTTYALGEEGAWYPPPAYRRPSPPIYTTQALGEEGGVYYRRW